MLFRSDQHESRQYPKHNCKHCQNDDACSHLRISLSRNKVAKSKRGERDEGRRRRVRVNETQKAQQADVLESRVCPSLWSRWQGVRKTRRVDHVQWKETSETKNGPPERDQQTCPQDALAELLV